MSELKDQLSKIIEGLKGFEEGMEKTRKGFDALPFIIRSYAERDFELGSGKSAEKWIEESRRYRSQLESLQAELEEDRKPSQEKIEECLSKTRAFIKSLEKLHQYLKNLPSKLASVPSYLLPNLDKSISEARKASEELEKFIIELKKLEETLEKLCS
ncbi:MAG: hypothetical protein DRJ46_02020 [Thermoprotei archaeon]|mgnify:CR=1 FL=1|nr:MAG: hypothetical protein DRJ46_02020 [Thermoprotei archaeon]